ncbi:MAG TPA: AMP-binding protein, partial [Spirochaetota bacterium]|nr:AMP-binding protein [Spirochaetota bacterium]
TALIIYTSGTTGSPKGVMLSFKNLRANIKAVSEDIPVFRPRRQTMLLLPLHHIFPLAGSLLAPLATGGTTVLCPGLKPAEIMSTLQHNQINIIIGVPRFYELLKNGITQKIRASVAARLLFNLCRVVRIKRVAKTVFKKIHRAFGGHIQYLVSGGAALARDSARFFETLGFDVLEGYGMSEAAPMISVPRPGHTKPGSVGQALPGLKLKIKKGEILAKGPNIMQGYYKRSGETKDILKQGWLYTGDLGRLDKEGHLYITGRKKEIIVLPSGKNINPEEMESKLLASPCIKEAAVFLNKNTLHALIVPAQDKISREPPYQDRQVFFRDKVLAGINKNFSPYKKIMQFTLTEKELPRTRLGKLKRHELSGLTAHQSSSSGFGEQDDTEYSALKSFLEKELKVKVKADAHLEYDLGLDSLAKIGFLDFIEKTFGLKLPENKLMTFSTPSQISRYIRKHKLFYRIKKADWKTIINEKTSFKLPQTWWSLAVFNFISKIIFKLFFKLRSEGLKNIPEGPAIITPNHQSFLDGFCLSAVFKKSILKNIYFYAKAKHFKTGIIKYLASKNNIILMDLQNGLKESIQKTAALLKQGKKVVIFPEGTRSRDGLMHDFKKTFAILSKNLNVPVLPVAICGSYNALPAGARLPRLRSDIRISCLRPVYPAKYSVGKITGRVKQLISARLKNSLKI